MGQKESGHVLRWFRRELESVVVESLGAGTCVWEGLAGECVHRVAASPWSVAMSAVAAPASSSSVPTAGFESLCSEVCLPFAGEGHNLFLCHLQF